jgi:hypothetical protein
MATALFLCEGRKRIQEVIEGGSVILPNGDQLSPVYDGWSNDKYTIKRLKKPEIRVEESVEILKCNGIQAKITLERYGLLDQVKMIVERSPYEIKIAFEESNAWTRDCKVLTRLMKILKLPDGSPVTDEVLDEMFRYAIKVEW